MAHGDCMLHVRSGIDIDAPAGEVFRLLCDPARKAGLNPRTEVLHAATVTPGGIGVGTRFFYRLRTPAGVRAFHCEVTAYVPGRTIEVLSDSAPAFRARQTLGPTARGCRLVHEEWLLRAAPAVPARAAGFLQLLGLLRHACGHALPTTETLDTANCEALRAQMLEALDAWLANIKRHLEAGVGQAPAALFA